MGADLSGALSNLLVRNMMERRGVANANEGDFADVVCLLRIG
jgi:hypothetical protein